MKDFQIDLPHEHDAALEEALKKSLVETSPSLDKDQTNLSEFSGLIVTDSMSLTISGNDCLKFNGIAQLPSIIKSLTGEVKNSNSVSGMLSFSKIVYPSQFAFQKLILEFIPTNHLLSLLSSEKMSDKYNQRVDLYTFFRGFPISSKKRLRRRFIAQESSVKIDQANFFKSAKFVSWKFLIPRPPSSIFLQQFAQETEINFRDETLTVHKKFLARMSISLMSLASHK